MATKAGVWLSFDSAMLAASESELGHAKIPCGDAEPLLMVTSMLPSRTPSSFPEATYNDPTTKTALLQ